ncbi:hypothetical protein [Cardiobacterium valvarum]|uniref:Uncharacterized protein n=1 Tax=Cardiobacterium valvarum TaxID=194702 RepID=A0A381DZM3_9GAMM|nr:hypothetical protein [Cardiobacterium valvarum]SUX18923.1 Uncharacterised protein [Cardiobacterium valvarum]
MLRQLLLTGGGIGYLLLWLIEGDLATRRLVRLLPAYPERRHLRRKYAA